MSSLDEGKDTLRYSLTDLMASLSAVLTKFLQQHGPVWSAIALTVFPTTLMVVAVSWSLGHDAPRITLKQAPIAGAIPQTPVKPQYPPIACFFVLIRASIICSLERLIVPSFFKDAIKAPQAIQAFSQPSIGTFSLSDIKVSAISKGFLKGVASTYLLIISKTSLP